MFLYSARIRGISFLLISSSLALNLALVSVAASSLPLPLLLPTNQTLPVSASSIPDFSILTSNTSPATENSAPVCNGNLLGFDMNRYSCLQAWSTIPINFQQLTFGDRLNGTFDVQLPRRFSGPDGTCVIDVFHKDGVISDMASYSQISRAAERLYGDCVASGGQRTQGGWIRDIGQSANLVVVLSLYEPAVACFGPYFTMRYPTQTLQNLLSEIPVSTERQIFGPEGEPGVKVVLPMTFSAPPNPSLRASSLRLVVDVAHRNRVSARWFDIWAGAVAVTAMCITRGYAGASGLPSGLGVTLRTGTGPGNGNETATS